MNKENVQKAINVMQRVIDRGGAVNMEYFQGNSAAETIINGIAWSEDSLHQCGTSACFSGWLAVSPEWKEFGGIQDPENGSAVFSFKEAVERKLLPSEAESKYKKTYYDEGSILFPHYSLACFLGISKSVAEDIIYPTFESNIYGKPVQEIKAQDVIDVLTKLLNGEELSVYNIFKKNCKCT